MIWFGSSVPSFNEVFLKRRRRFFSVVRLLIHCLIRNRPTSGNRRPYRTPLAPLLANHRLVFSHFWGAEPVLNKTNTASLQATTRLGMKAKQNERPLKWLPLKTLLANASESNQSGDFNWSQQQELIIALNQSSSCCLGEEKKRSKFIEVSSRRPLHPNNNSAYQVSFCY